MGERVPSGATAKDRPSFSAATTGSKASRAFALLPRSINATFANQPIGPKNGSFSSDFFATPVKFSRSNVSKSSSFLTALPWSVLNKWWKRRLGSRVHDEVSGSKPISFSYMAITAEDWLKMVYTSRTERPYCSSIWSFRSNGSGPRDLRCPSIRYVVIRIFRRSGSTMNL